MSLSGILEESPERRGLGCLAMLPEPPEWRLHRLGAGGARAQRAVCCSSGLGEEGLSLLHVDADFLCQAPEPKAAGNCPRH